MNRRHLKEIVIVTAIFSAVVALFFWPAALGGKFLYQGDLSGSDLLNLNVPRRVMVARAFLSGEIPLWEPRIGNGTLLLAEGHPGPFYPTTLPLYGFLSATAATNISILSALIIAMLGAYVLARCYGASPGAASFAALAYGLGGTFIFRLKNINIVQIIAFIPLTLAFIRLYFREGSKRYLFALTFVWSCQLLAGHPQAAFIGQVTCWAFIAAELLSKSNGCSTAPSRRRALVSLVICAVLALMLSAIQLLPTFTFARESSRATAYDDAYLQKQSIANHHLCRFIQPYCDGNPTQGTFNLTGQDLIWESTPYLGLIPLALIPLAFLGPRRPRLWYAFALATFFFILACGPRAYLLSIFSRYCPGFGFFRYPERFIIPMACFLTLLSAIGAQNLKVWLEKRGQKRCASIVIAILLALTTIDLYRVSAEFQSYLPASWEKRPEALELIGDDHQRIYPPTSWYTLLMKTMKQGYHDSVDPILADAQSMTPDLATIWDVRSPVDYNTIGGGISIQLFSEQLNWLNGSLFNDTFNPQANTFHLSPELMPMLRINNISHIVSYIPLDNAEHNPDIAKVQTCQPVGANSPLYIYELSQPLPEARLVPVLVDEMPSLLQTGRNPLNPQTESLYEPDYNNLANIGTVSLQKDGRNERTYVCDCPQECYLILSSTYHHDWKASIDGSALRPIRCVNYCFQAVSLPAGKHTVTLRFTSPSFDWGWKISVLALLVCFALAGWAWCRSKKG